MKSIRLLLVFVIASFAAVAQDTTTLGMKELAIAFGTFSTLSADKVLQVNPAISGYFGNYYFEERYGYEGANSVSLNIGKQILKNSKHVYIIPMGGLVFGSFKGITAEVQSSLDYKRVALSTDNQLSLEYTRNNSHFFSNWSVVRYKLNKAFHIGITTSFIKTINQNKIFDKGGTIAIFFDKWSIRFYAFNFKTKNSYYWLSLRYILRLKFIKQ